ncbi:MAG: hypothetical protein NC489_37885 [Ruminococcus flavefaciens]|nr:hypothetical protein [Ruminococcus flavefaciens]
MKKHKYMEDFDDQDAFIDMLIEKALMIYVAGDSSAPYRDYIKKHWDELEPIMRGCVLGGILLAGEYHVRWED